MPRFVGNPRVYDNKIQNLRCKCSCGHTSIIPVKTQKTICSVCGNTIYNSGFAKFKGELGKVMKKKFI